MSSLREIRAEFIHIYESVASKRGLPPILGRIMAVFFLEQRELSQTEVAALAGYSVSSVSRTLEQMIRMGLVHKHKDPFHRHSVYHMNVDYRDLTIGGLGTWIRQAEESMEEMRSLRLKVEALELAGEEAVEARRLQEMLRNMEERAESLLKTIRKAVEELRRSDS